VQANPVAAYAREQGLTLAQPEKPGRELGDWLRALGVDLALVMAYGHFLPKSVREAPRQGMLNFHASLLPAYRGASPVETALASGEVETGVCLMQVVREMDAGAVAGQERVRIDPTDTGPSLREKIAQAVVPLLERRLPGALSGELQFTAQDESRASFCRKIGKRDAAIDFSLSAALIDARRRAFTPWPGAVFLYRETAVRLGHCEVSDAPAGAAPGLVLEAGEALAVATGEGILRVLEMQRPGGRMLPAGDFLRGFPINVGDRLPSVVTEPPLVLSAPQGAQD
jgi:methionyl-tRNA formyltransferase